MAKAWGLDPRVLDKNNTDDSRKLLPKFKRPYSVRSFIDTVVRIFRNGINPSLSIDHVTKLLASLRAAQLSAATGGAPESEAAIAEAVTNVGTTVQDSRGPGSVREDEEKYVTEKLVGRSRTAAPM